MRQIVLMILALSSWMLCAAEPESSLDSVLSQHRERVATERKKIEERHASCVRCKGTNEVVDTDFCTTCHGSGLISTRKGQATISKPCATCSGKGSFESRTPCPRCCPYVVVESKTQQPNQKPEVKASAPEKQKCTACSGKGYHLKEVGCGSCNGSGTIVIPAKQMISGWTNERRSQCTACSGKGKKSLRERCRTCNGLGNLKQAKASEQKTSAAKKEVQPPKFDLLKWLTWSAEHGDARAQYCLGVMYATGDGVAKSVKDSEKWLKMSADNGNVFARMIEEAKVADQIAREKKARDEAEAAARAAEEKRLAEERRLAAEKRAAEEKRIAEEKRLAEERRIEEERREEEERRLAEQAKEELEAEAKKDVETLEQTQQDECEDRKKSVPPAAPLLITHLAGTMLGGVVVGLLLFSLAKFGAFKVNPGLKAKVSEKALSKIKSACVVLCVVLGLLSTLAARTRRGPSVESSISSSNDAQWGALSVQQERELLDKAAREMSGVFELSIGVFANTRVFVPEYEGVQAYRKMCLFVVDPANEEALGKEIQAMLYVCQQLKTTASGAAESVKLVRSNETATQKEQCMLVAVAMVAVAEAVEEYCGFVGEFHASEIRLAKLGIDQVNGGDVERKLENFIKHHKAMTKVFGEAANALKASVR